MSMNSSAVSPTQNKSTKIVSWVLRVLAAAAFLAAGSAKLIGVPMMVEIFNHIGIGQWFRVVTGLVEVAGSVAILVPATAGLGGVLLAATMVCAVMTHLFVIGGNPIPAVVLFAITATVAWLHRARLATLLGRR
ncbi:MAG: DoxX family protein [Trinickia sp.]|uniref:DoxX family protein n=1 Tax=Trinickia sp. TaxID=2571163 RepID=UPI003F7EE8C8